MPKYINLDKLVEMGYTHLKGHVCKDGHCGVVLTPLDELEVIEIEEVLEAPIKHITEQYAKAKKVPEHIKKPIAWALYKAWRRADNA